MSIVMTRYYSPWCGFDGLSGPAYSQLGPSPWPHLGSPPYAAHLGFPSYEVCSCCGFEYGFDDDPGASANSSSFEENPAAWLASGAVWFSHGAKSERWHLPEQLGTISEAAGASSAAEGEPSSMRLRVSLRTTLILVPLLGVLLSQGAVCWQRRESRLRMARHHSAIGEQYWRKAATYPVGHPLRQAFAAAGSAHLEPAWRYRYAADHPWRAVPAAGAVRIPVQHPVARGRANGSSR